MQAASRAATALNLPAICAGNLLTALLSEEGMARNIIAKNIDPAVLVAKIGKSLVTRPRVTPCAQSSGTLTIEKDVGEIIQAAEQFAQNEGTTVDSQHLLYGMLNVQNEASVFLSFYGLNLQRAKDIAASLPKPTDTTKVVETVKTDSASKDSCGSSCGCPVMGNRAVIDAANQSANDHAKQVSGQNTAVSRKEWFEVLEIALKMNEQSGLNVPAAFVHASMAHSSIITREAITQIRRSTLNDVSEQILSIKP